MAPKGRAKNLFLRLFIFHGEGEPFPKDKRAVGALCCWRGSHSNVCKGQLSDVTRSIPRHGNVIAEIKDSLSPVGTTRRHQQLLARASCFPLEIIRGEDPFWIREFSFFSLSLSLSLEDRKSLGQAMLDRVKFIEIRSFNTRENLT